MKRLTLAIAAWLVICGGSVALAQPAAQASTPNKPASLEELKLQADNANLRYQLGLLQAKEAQTEWNRLQEQIKALQPKPAPEPAKPDTAAPAKK